MKKETFIEKKIALENLRAMMAKSMYLLTASEESRIGIAHLMTTRKKELHTEIEILVAAPVFYLHFVSS